jgi:hypothetical protein
VNRSTALRGPGLGHGRIKRKPDSPAKTGWAPSHAAFFLSRRRLCISGFFAAKSSGKKDVIGLSPVTIGARASVETQKLFAGGDAAAIRDWFRRKYHGSRYSAGYPACLESGRSDEIVCAAETGRKCGSAADFWIFTGARAEQVGAGGASSGGEVLRGVRRQS